MDSPPMPCYETMMKQTEEWNELYQKRDPLEEPIWLNAGPYSISYEYPMTSENPVCKCFTFEFKIF